MVSGVLLCAGESRRMGRENKLLLTHRDMPLVRAAVLECLGSKAGEWIVVTGYQDRQVKEALEGLELRFVHNPGFYSGMSESIKVGIAAVASAADAAMICLADMPGLKSMHYDALIGKFSREKAKGLRPILRPVHRERPGHPVLFDRSFFGQILASKDTEGCASVIQANRAHYLPYPLANEAYYRDIDTPVDCHKWRE